jgi:4-hydroxy 2-oxovalerate aldolase
MGHAESGQQFLPSDLTLLDVTLRDGGYINAHGWTLEEAEATVRAAGRAGLSWTEVGYYRPSAAEPLPPAACCPDPYLERLAESAGTVGLCVMAMPGQVVAADLRRLPKLGVGMVRLPTRPDNLEEVLALIAAAREAGLEACLNVIRVSELPGEVLGRMLATAAGGSATAVYLADSNSSLFPAKVADLIGRCVETLPVPVGFHAHDGLSLAFANSLAALTAGARYLDASLGGIGKGGGNLAAELIAPYLRLHHGLPFRLQPLVQASAVVVRSRSLTDHVARASSVVHGLLDHNLEAISSIRRELPDRDIPAFFDTLPDPLSSAPLSSAPHSSAPLSPAPLPGR